VEEFYRTVNLQIVTMRVGLKTEDHEFHGIQLFYGKHFEQ